MRLTTFFTIGLAAASMASADFSYTVTRKSTGGMMGGMANAGPTTTKMYYKGQKLKVDLGDTATILDFDAQTITSVNSRAKTWSVRPFSELAPAGKAGDMKFEVNVKEPGQARTVNGFNCSELILTVDADLPQARQMGKVQLEVDSWISPDVPGSDQVKAFYQRNAANFPWGAIAQGANADLERGWSEIRKKMATMNGVQVQQIIRVKAPGMAADTGAQVQAAQPALAQARARLEAMIAQGGPAAAAAKQALARMGGGSAPSGSSGGSALLEMTMDSSDFSTAAIPDSTFTVPADFSKASK